MFNNPSKKLKIIANIVFVIFVVFSFIMAFLFGRDYSYSSYKFHFGFFILILIVSLIFDYVFCLLIYGFGQLIENTEPRKNNNAETPSIESESSDFEWKCPKCRKVHHKYVDACSCGEKTP